jgi:hypothetical protein
MTVVDVYGYISDISVHLNVAVMGPRPISFESERARENII